MRKVNVGGIKVGAGEPFVLIAGPCVIEGEKLTRRVAARLREMTAEMGIPFIFKSSYDKANRSSLRSFRGPGLDRGLKILAAIREEFGIPVLSDVHRFEEIEKAAEVLDVAQIPAFLCRQTDFVTELARHARAVNIKKGQFLAPWDVANVVQKVESAGNRNILITERGASFGYNNLVSDMRSIPILRSMGYPVVFDATHSVQLPGGAGASSGGDRAMAVFLARAATAVGVDAVFLEVHPDPDRARCDGPNSIALDSLRGLLATLQEIDRLVKKDMKKGR
ncbi:MAG: 2-dehydro-3-deoxyphosphooctonate aldolase [Syntrophaceae bacterium PtaB.Bin038]|nr:MAG: 2-dehydro-3-deoxyphosphooctonate aldolase [Syntrophaceae bacterium PtaB.Bin038]